jgi:hypothetical protein
MGHRTDLSQLCVALSLLQDVQTRNDKALMDIQATTPWVNDFPWCSS